MSAIENVPKSGENIRSFPGAKDLKRDFNMLLDFANLYTDDAPFWIDGDIQWSCDPESFTNAQFPNLVRLLYYIGNINIIMDFISFICKEKPFRFNNKDYMYDEDFGEFAGVWKSQANRSIYAAAFHVYYPQFINRLKETGLEPRFEALRKKSESLFQ